MRHNNWLYFVALPLAAIALAGVVTAGAAQARPAPAPAPLAAPAAPAITPTPHAGRFEDVPPSHPFAFFVECMGGRSIINGYQCGGPGEPCGAENKPYFRPGANVTRGQAAKILAGSAGYNEPVPPTQQTFADVPPTQPFWLWIERVAERGIINGYTCGGPGEPCDPANRPYFRPANDLTRGQLAKIDAQAGGYTDPIPPTQQTFADVPPTQPFWLWTEQVALHGVVSGYTCGGPGEPCDPANRPYFRPSTNVTRSQTAKIGTGTFFPTCEAPPPTPTPPLPTPVPTGVVAPRASGTNG